MAGKKKVPEYTAKAIERYHAKFDRVAVSLPKGSKEWIKETTGKSCNAFFNELFQKYKDGETVPASAQAAPELGINSLLEDYERRLALDHNALPFE